MKRAKRAVSVIVLLGLFTALATSGQMGRPAAKEEDGLNLPLLITVNRMELTRDQMDDLYGILTDVSEGMTDLKADRATFEQEMLAFTGTEDELDALLETRQEAMEDRAASLQETMQDALDEIQGLLTMEQGKILEEGFPGFFLLFGGRAGGLSRSGILAPRGMWMEERVPQAMIGPPLRQFEGNGTGRTALPEELQERMEQWREPRSDRLAMRMRIQHPEYAFSIVEDLMEILEAKLEYLS